MLILNDGPAEGGYMVGRALLWLRAVVSAKGKTDVLDQLHDEPKPRETISVYRRITAPEQVGQVIARLSGRRGCVASVSAEYQRLPDVDGEAMRDTEAWRAWALEQHRLAQTAARRPARQVVRHQPVSSTGQALDRQPTRRWRGSVPMAGSRPADRSHRGRPGFAGHPLTCRRCPVAASGPPDGWTDTGRSTSRNGRAGDCPRKNVARGGNRRKWNAIGQEPLSRVS